MDEEKIVETTWADIRGANCTCDNPSDHGSMVHKVNESHKRDYDGSRRVYADEVSTSTALRQRAAKARSKMNGHG